MLPLIPRHLLQLSSGVAIAALFTLGAAPALAAEPFATGRARAVPAAALSGSQVTQIPQAAGGSAVNVAASRGTVVVEAGSGRIVTLGTAVTSVFTADPKVVDVRPASPTTLFLFGVAPGKSTVAVMDGNGHMAAQWEVVVKPSSYGASEASAAIDRTGASQNVQVEQRGDGLVVHGTVATPGDAERAMATARGYASPKQTVENRLQIAGTAQVTLKVRIAEMSRNLTRELGFNWQGLGNIGRLALGLNINNPLVNAVLPFSAASARYTSGGIDVNSVIDALAQDQLIHILAEPTLTAMSGETASFLAGGEFAIPVASNSNGGSLPTVTVEFKQYGVSLAFVPTVLSSGQINLKVRPEVSQLSSLGAVSINNITIPGLTVRRAETTVELGSGQSFAIAGLLQDQTTLTGNGLPFLGDIPIIGALFRSDGFQRQETELVIVVTPYLTRPTSDGRSISLPTDGWTPPDDKERLLLLRQNGTTPVSAQVGSGFVVR